MARTAVGLLSRLSPPLAARLVHRLFFTPPRLPMRADQRQILAAGQPFTLQVRGERIKGWHWGAGPAVALVHGWGGHGGSMTALVAPLVKAGLRPITWDMPAHGASTGRVASLVHFAATLETVAEAYGPLRGVVAHSLGCAASAHAFAGGLPVERAVFFAPPAHLEPLWVRVRTTLGVPNSIWSLMVSRAEHWLDTSFADLVPATLAPTMRQSLLILHDREDTEIPASEGAALAALWPQAMIEQSAGLGHRRILRDPLCLTRAVSFLAGAEPGDLFGHGARVDRVAMPAS